MSTAAQIFIIVIVLFFNINIISKLRSDLLEYRYAFIWLAAGIAMLVFSIYPPLLENLSSLLGIGVPLNLLFFLGVVLSLYLVFSLMVSYALLRRRFTHVVQTLAILQHDMEIMVEKKGISSPITAGQNSLKPETSRDDLIKL